MKKIIYAVLIGLMMKGVMFAAVQKEIVFQAVLSDENKYISGDKAVVFKIYPKDSDSYVWTETQTVSFVNGAITVTLGKDTPIELDMLDINQARLGILVNEKEIRLPFSNVPYALLAQGAKELVGKLPYSQLATTNVGNGNILMFNGSEWIATANNAITGMSNGSVMLNTVGIKESLVATKSVLLSNVNFTQIQPSTSGSTIAIDWTKGIKQKISIAADKTITFTDPAQPANVSIILYHNGNTITWAASNIKWPGGIQPTLSSEEGSIDMINFYYDGTNYLGSAITSFQ